MAQRRSPAVRWLFEHAESIAFALAMCVIGSLLVWWGVFADRLIHEVGQLLDTQARATLVGPALDDALASVMQRSARQQLMIIGEGSMFAAALFVCVGVLFVMARQRRLDHRRLERLLQFTAHELKTPIAGVRALLQSLQLGSIPEASRARFLEQGLSETNRLEHLVETILAYQRAAVRQHLSAAAQPSDALLLELVEHRKHTLGERITVHAVPAPILVDKDAFRVVIENLLDNARKYGGADVEVRGEVAGDRYRLRVIDRGQGFSGDGERLFDPFARAEREGQTSHGSGLGLYISRQLMREMGGDLSAFSDGDGRGSTFVVDVPTAPLAQPAGASDG